MEYFLQSRDTVIQCMLLAVDFDERIFKLMPFPNDHAEEEPFWARCEHVKRPRPKPHITA